MKPVALEFGPEKVEINLPDNTDLLRMNSQSPLINPAEAIQRALINSIKSPGLDLIIEEKLKTNPNTRAVVVISDNTRPVPYKGDSGILWPVLKKLMDHGLTKDQILILVANGTHRALTDTEFRKMLDPRVFELGIPIKNHDCRNKDCLVFLGKTARGSKIYINREYMECDLKILTGLVESHFMAGASGGRKSVCPGLIGEESTYVFHSASLLASPMARDLVLQSNPCHEEAVEIAIKAGVDYIINVTINPHFEITGVFAGDLIAAHQEAVKKLQEYISIKNEREYDIIITHAGFVGINHYQAAKAGVAAIPAIKPNGKLIMVANNTDKDPVGSRMYQTVLHLLKMMGVEKFNRLLLSPDWSFIPEQWQVQMWAKLFSKIPFQNMVYYSPQLSERDYQIIPGRDGNLLLAIEERYRLEKKHSKSVANVIELALQEAIKELETKGQAEKNIAFLADGPYGILMNDY